MTESTPYFVYPMLRELETSGDREVRQRLKQLVALNVGPTETLRELFGLDSESLADFYGDMSSPHPTTDDTIDSFIRQFGKPSAVAAAGDSLFAGEGVPGVDPLLGGVDVPSDYMASLLASESAPQASPAEVPENTPGEAPADDSAPSEECPPSGSEDEAPQPVPAENSESGSLSEGLARILIKNGNYTKALEIISGLYLNNPEKSIYFADQIRFIKKLMLNQSRKQ